MAEENTDWKAEFEEMKTKYEEMRKHSREWEKRSNEYKAAAQELEQLKAAQMSEQEKEKARADAAEQELARIKAERERAEKAREIAKETGTPLELLEFCSDEEAMRGLAKSYQEKPPVKAAPNAASSRVVREQADENADMKAFVNSLFNES